MSLSRRSAAAAIVAVSVALGGGLALASPEDPTTEGDPVVQEPTGETTGEDAGTTEDLDGTGVGTETGEGLEGEDGTEGEGEDDGTGTEDEDGADEPRNHGALVSEAAHEHAYDEACGNHGKYVSAVARTGEQPECATATEGEGDEATATEGGSTATATATATSSDSGKGKAKAKAKTRTSRGRGRG